MQSHVSDLLEVAECVYKDATAKSTANTPDKRDLDTLRSRVKHEGLSFLTITLPTIGKDLERCLSEGRIVPGLFRSFRKRLKGPAFLQVFFEQVFDYGSGGLHDEPSVVAIESIRQIAYTFKKLKTPCTTSRVDAALHQFEMDEAIFEIPLEPEEEHDFHCVSRLLWTACIADIQPLQTVPKHGPGATAEKLSGNRKFRCSRWHDRLEPYFPMLHNLFHNENVYGSPEFERVTVVSEEHEQPVRVTPVPKTLKSPRIIAIEPVCMQYAQQALSRELVQRLESYVLTRGHVNFTDQKINRNLAMRSSSDGSMATLDMSSASDRVPYELAISMFEGNPDLQGAISACRSTRAELPNSKVINLKKFASMGSALCFPVEAMYFYTICIVALIRSRSLQMTFQSVRDAARDVYVYGDDIIVPTDEAVVVMETLQKYYCKVNVAKSFWTGKFRESCGMDAYAGEEVTPTYLRNLQPHDRRDSSALISWVEASNHFYERGYWQTSSHLYKKCEKIIGKLPIVSRNSAGLGLISYQRYVSQHRWNAQLHRPEVRALVAAPIYQRDKLDGYYALAKCLIKLSNPGPPDLALDDEHLVRSARHGAVRLKRRWTPPY